jgi:cytochrome c2
LVGLAQGMLVATAFLVVAGFLATAARRPEGVSPAVGLMVGAVSYGAAYWFLHTRPDALYAESDLLVAASLGIALAFLPSLLPAGLRKLVLAVLLFGVGGLLFAGVRHVVTSAPQAIALSTALGPLDVRVYHSLVDPGPRDRGGGIVAHEDGFLLVTASGDFYDLSWSGDTLSATPLGLSVDEDPIVAPTAHDELESIQAQAFRVTGLVVDGSTEPATVYVAHERYDAANRCFAVRVARALLPPDPAAPAPWTPVFESSPCVEVFPGIGYLEAGGRLAKLGERLLVTIGDFALAERGRPSPAQSSEGSHGKVWAIDPDGQATVFTMGHRNAQGLSVDDEGQVWLTEHGPQGGDELNLLQEGRNYGYPVATYGTDYGRYYWPFAAAARNHGTFEEPVFAFTPSIGISNVTRVEADLFSGWRDDLLIASLNRESLYRVRLRENRAIYVEPIFLGHRIRDLAEGVDGRLVLWTDGGRVVTIAPASATLDGAQVFSRCRACHDSTVPQPGDLTLKGVVGREVASVGGYQYSAGLRALAGTWTEARLDSFLADPAVYAPGSMMSAGRVPDDAERRALIRFLRDHD